MWRFFRFGIKSNNCSGNQAHFRAIGTTCANGECDEKIEEGSDASFNKETVPRSFKENFAAKAAKEHQNFLKYNSSKQHSTGILFNGADKLKSGHDSLSPNQWRQHLIQKKSLTPEGKKAGKQALYVKKKQNKNNNFAEEISQAEDGQTGEEEEKFGSLSKIDRKFEYVPEEKEELKYLLKENYGEKLEAQSYGIKMLALCKERKLKEALNILEVEMKIQNVPPNEYCYNVLINACGKAGYAKKGFQLYTQLKQKCLKVQKFVYTGLFNACANTPFKAEGLESARKLRKELKDKEKSLSPISYHAMIKAFGHCGDVETAFEIADEMLDVRHPVTTETMNFLLQACITDRENGFRHALMVWRRMRALKITPCLYSYNLLLRCVKECQAGEPKLVSNILDGLHPSKHGLQLRKNERQLETERRTFVEESVPVRPVTQVEKSEGEVGQEGQRVASSSSSPKDEREENMKNEDRQKSIYQIPEGSEVVRVNLDEDMELEIVSSKLPVPAEDEALPDVLARKFRLGKVTSITSLQTREDRLWLLGGITGVVENMMQDRVMPTVMTFTYLLDSLPLTLEVEEALLSSMELCKVVPDVIFCNKLIRRRSFRSLTEAKEVLELMQKHHVLVDLISFGCLAIACRKPSEMETFFKDMDRAGFVPNEEIVETLLKNCMTSSEFGYSIEVLKRMRGLRLKPNENILHTLEETRKVIRERTIRNESNDQNPPLSLREKRIREEMKLFQMEYKHWLKMSKVELKDHPWTQFGYQDRGQQVAKVSKSS